MEPWMTLVLVVIVGEILRSMWRSVLRPRRTVVVHTDDSTSIRGVVRSTTPHGITLFGAVHLDSGGTELGGDVFIPRGRVVFVQQQR